MPTGTDTDDAPGVLELNNVAAAAAAGLAVAPLTRSDAANVTASPIPNRRTCRLP
jgi:hypothetical protein